MVKKYCLDEHNNKIPFAVAQAKAAQDENLREKVVSLEGQVQYEKAQMSAIKDAVLECGLIFEKDKSVSFTVCNLIKKAYQHRGELSGDTGKAAEQIGKQQEAEKAPDVNDPDKPNPPVSLKPDTSDKTGRRPDLSKAIPPKGSAGASVQA